MNGQPESKNQSKNHITTCDSGIHPHLKHFCPTMTNPFDLNLIPPDTRPTLSPNRFVAPSPKLLVANATVTTSSLHGCSQPDTGAKRGRRHRIAQLEHFRPLLLGSGCDLNSCLPSTRNPTIRCAKDPKTKTVRLIADCGSGPYNFPVLATYFLRPLS